MSSRAGKRQLSSPIVAGLFSAELFVPSSILPRLEIPPVLSSQECSAHWPDSSLEAGVARILLSNICEADCHRVFSFSNGPHRSHLRVEVGEVSACISPEVTTGRVGI